MADTGLTGAGNTTPLPVANDATNGVLTDVHNAFLAVPLILQLLFLGLLLLCLISSLRKRRRREGLATECLGGPLIAPDPHPDAPYPYNPAPTPDFPCPFNHVPTPDAPCPYDPTLNPGSPCPHDPALNPDSLCPYNHAPPPDSPYRYNPALSPEENEVLRRLHRRHPLPPP